MYILNGKLIQDKSNMNKSIFNQSKLNKPKIIAKIGNIKYNNPFYLPSPANVKIWLILVTDATVNPPNISSTPTMKNTNKLRENIK